MWAEREGCGLELSLRAEASVEGSTAASWAPWAQDPVACRPGWAAPLSHGASGSLSSVLLTSLYAAILATRLLPGTSSQ